MRCDRYTSIRLYICGTHRELISVHLCFNFSLFMFNISFGCHKNNTKGKKKRKKTKMKKIKEGFFNFYF